MRLITIALFWLALWGSAAAAASFEYRGVDVSMREGNTTRHYQVRRERPEKCKKVSGNAMLWGGSYAAAAVPEECKGSYVETFGTISPIRMDDEIETYGELETLSFLKEMQKDPSKVLIDTRKEAWFRYRTIPGAVNMPYYYFRDRAHYEDEFAYAMHYLGGKLDEEGDYAFENPKTILVFCNGPWCRLSAKFVQAVTEAGFPADHIKWFRGGMQAWLIGGFTSTRPRTQGK